MQSFIQTYRKVVLAKTRYMTGKHVFQEIRTLEAYHSKSLQYLELARSITSNSLASLKKMIKQFVIFPCQKEDNAKRPRFTQ